MFIRLLHYKKGQLGLLELIPIRVSALILSALFHCLLNKFNNGKTALQISQSRNFMESLYKILPAINEFLFSCYIRSSRQRVTSHFGTFYSPDMISDSLALLSSLKEGKSCFCHL